MIRANLVCKNCKHDHKESKECKYEYQVIAPARENDFYIRLCGCLKDERSKS